MDIYICFYIYAYIYIYIYILSLTANFFLYKFSYILHLLHTHRWFNITNIILHSPDDGSLEPKRYTVDFASQ